MHAPSKSTASLASHFAGLVVVSGLWPEFRRLPGNCSRHNFDATGFFSHFPPFLTLFRENPAFLSTKLTFLRELKPFYFELKPFYFELKPFYFELKSFYFELKPFYFELKSFYFELKSFLLGQISFFLGQFRQKTAFFSGLLPEIRVMCAFACS
jgi:transcription initiation factor TFIID subunit 15